MKLFIICCARNLILLRLPTLYNESILHADDCDIVMELRKTLMNTGMKLGRGIAMIVDAILKVSMLKPAQENSIPQQPRPRVRVIIF